jgi:hypothetical protein
MRIAAFLNALFLSATSADACLNDRELPAHEREFRSQYNSQLMTDSSPSQSSYFESTQLVTASGIALITAAVGIAWVGRRT